MRLILAGAAAADELDWVWTWNGPGNGSDVAEAVAADPAGNLLVAGWTDRGGGAGIALALAKLSPAGVLLWSRSHASLPGGVAAAFGVAADRSGNAYVAGSVSVTGGTSDGFLRKYGPDGAVLWTTQYNGSADEQDVFWAVAVDPESGSVYVAATEAVTSPPQSGNWALLRYAEDGSSVVKLAAYNGSASLWDEPYAIAVAGNGDVIVAGYATAGETGGPVLDDNLFGRRAALTDKNLGGLNSDVTVIRFRPAGIPVWSASFGSEATPLPQDYRKDSAWGVATDAAGAVYVVGTIGGEGSNNFPIRWARKYSSDGSLAPWTRLMIGEPNRLNAGRGAAASPGGLVYVAGASDLSSSFQGLNLTVDSLDATLGFTVWPGAYSPGFKSDEEGRGVAIVASGAVAVAGSSRLQGDEADWLVVRFRPSEPAPAPPVGTLPYPNPFNPEGAAGGTLKFPGLPNGASVRLYTLAGRLVAELRESGGIARWDGRTGDGARASDGIYWWVAEAGGKRHGSGALAVSRK